MRTAGHDSEVGFPLLRPIAPKAAEFEPLRRFYPESLGTPRELPIPRPSRQIEKNQPKISKFQNE